MGETGGRRNLYRAILSRHFRAPRSRSDTRRTYIVCCWIFMESPRSFEKYSLLFVACSPFSILFAVYFYTLVLLFCFCTFVVHRVPRVLNTSSYPGVYKDDETARKDQQNATGLQTFYSHETGHTFQHVLTI